MLNESIFNFSENEINIVSSLEKEEMKSSTTNAAAFILISKEDIVHTEGNK